MFVKAVVLICLIQAALTFTVEINNIHNGYRNVYQGSVQLSENSRLLVNQFNTIKQELTAQEASFLSVSSAQIGLDLNNFVRQYYEQDIDPSAPRLVFRYYQQPSIVLTLFSQTEQQSEIEQLNSMLTLGRDMSDLDL